MDEIARMEEKLGNLNLNERAGATATKALDKMEKHMSRALEVAQNGEFETDHALIFLNKFEQKMKHVHERLDGVHSMNERMFNAKQKIEQRIANLRKARQKIEVAPHQKHMKVPLRNFFERTQVNEAFLPLRFAHT
jgi:DNA repair exonuclease SbcCD ATPase subunit